MHHCKVCGLYHEDPPWGEDGQSPTYNICACCGVEFGNDDYTPEAVLKYRQACLDKGSVWFEPKERPANWNLEEQLKAIPKGFH